MALPRVATGLSAVCDFGISGSYSLFWLFKREVFMADISHNGYLYEQVTFMRGSRGQGTVGSSAILVRIPWKITMLPSQRSILDHYWPANETPFKWRFDDGPMMADFLLYLDPSQFH